MPGKKSPSHRQITSLDLQAKKLGIGGKLSPEIDESLYKKECNKEKKFSQRD